jgi:hypothetical protein
MAQGPELALGVLARRSPHLLFLRVRKYVAKCYERDYRVHREALRQCSTVQESAEWDGRSSRAQPRFFVNRESKKRTGHKEQDQVAS